MKTKVMKEVEIEIALVDINVAVRYGDEDMPYDFPGRNGETWGVRVNVDTGQILNWPAGTPYDLHMKVCDQGSYYLYSTSQLEVASIENDYVPHGLIPGSYGDYLEFTILSDGTIENWPATPDVSEFFPEGGEL